MAPHAVCAKEDSVIPDNVFQLPTIHLFGLHTVCYAPSSCICFCFFFSEKASSAMLYNTQSYHQNVSLFRFW